ncbi:DUF1266 domain-containing protein [Escherichia coli]|uniref:DUF1266 domain-containing protein n=1 Tax=Escherichia TaxID=561 RepID=UPI000CF757E0|nr:MULTISPECIES: DUF1266 domain-containing protein [Escherichia]EGO6714009.1 DUF1266 domain-containing protein [Escherichia coli]EGO7509305.1 DUF1266 domain-containing protein [Escherichia coli]EGO8030798.1 DUF1266 domain-containing protein [Escherichia coli]EGO8360569.1 DUF1266 domain-containing protein [Escherichia coli]EGO8378006.1 DUF1266 domain-containing protein [Escherichia coli]
MDKYTLLGLAVTVPVALTWAWLDVKRKRKKRDNAPLLNDTMRFVNGTHLVITVLNGGDYRLLAGHEYNKDNRLTAKGRCKRFWGVEDISAGMEMLQSLVDGRHNEQFLQELKHITENVINLETEQNWQTLFTNITDKKMLTKMRVMHDAHLDFGNNAILAWDLSRANHLLADYYLAGWIDEQRYIKEVFDVTSKIQKNFSSWDEFNKSYLYGYLWWSGEDQQHDLKKLGCYHNRVMIINKQKDVANSPFKLDWDTPLKIETSPYA